VANIMIRKTEAGGLSFYLPKRDLEDNIVSIEFDRRRTACSSAASADFLARQARRSG